jgi:myo-inositol-1(or 4)-monophosphatase
MPSESVAITAELLTGANAVIRSALMSLRPELLAAYGHTAHTVKADSSVVTELDLKVEQQLHAALHEFDPRIGHAGEETSADLTQTTFWLIDPIDGTETFIRGLPFATNMIVLIHEGEPVMSVIYNFVLDEYFHAVRGGGSTKNGQPIHVSNRPLERAFVSFGSKLHDPKIFGVWERMRLKVQNMPQMGATGYILSAVASGATDGIITYGTGGGVWDFAPGALLIREAGGHVANIGSDTYDYRNVEMVAAGEQIFGQLKTFIEDEIKEIS